MEYILWFKDFILHLDKHLGDLVQTYGSWTYAILFAIVFCETGLVVTPFLPGDSLLFTAGALAGINSISFWGLFAALGVAAFLGDTANYWIGRKVGPKVFAREDVRFLNKKHLVKAHQFYEKYGAKTIVIARFIPIIRTFAPFVAGIGQMSYGKFIAYNIIGGVMWVGICLSAGFAFGSHPFVKKNFSLVIFAIILISILPAVIEFLRERAKSKASQATLG